LMIRKNMPIVRLSESIGIAAYLEYPYTKTLLNNTRKLIYINILCATIQQKLRKGPKINCTMENKYIEIKLNIH